MSTIEHSVEFYDSLVIVDEKKSKKVATKRAKEATEVSRKEAKKEIEQESTVKKTDQKVSKKTIKVDKSLKKIKMSQYNSFDLDTCFSMAKMMGVNLNYNDYLQILMENDDTKKVAKKIIKDYKIPKKFTFEDYGFDESLVEVICKKVLSTMEISASDFKSLAEEFKNLEEYKFGEDSFLDNETYKHYLNILNNGLVLAKRKNYTDLNGLKRFIKIDAEEAFLKFTELAKHVLKLWKTEDIKIYEKIIYASLSQFDDLYEKYEYSLMMDICDLYIIHGELKKGNCDYEYIIRENEIKDYPYYRYAQIYQKVDLEYSKQIAQKACSILKKDSQYYSNIKEIAEA